MAQAIVTVGLGFGDEGKGATVDYLCRELDVDLVVRYSGGSQCGHNVQLADGHRHTFSQFGAGTFKGVRTYLDSQVIINPRAMLRESSFLQDFGITKPFNTVTVHPNCLVSTFYHQRTNQIKELARSGSRHGSCGHGIGETRSYWLKYGLDAITAADLRNEARLREKFQLLRQRYLIVAGPHLDRLNRTDAQTMNFLNFGIEEEINSLLYVGDLLQIDDALPPHSKTTVFEGAQGVLLDEWYGAFPYVTHSTVTPRHALDRIAQSSYERMTVLGITRTYTTRHGAGPFPTYDENLTRRLPDPGNPTNPWQESFRCGFIDLPLLDYAARVCKIDGLVVNHWDQAKGLPYACEHERQSGAMANNLPHHTLNEILAEARPNYTLSDRFANQLEESVPTVLFPTDGGDAEASHLWEQFEKIAPIVITGHGPSAFHRRQYLGKLVFRKPSVL